MKLDIISFPQNMFDDCGFFVAEASDLGNRHLQTVDETFNDRGFVMETNAHEKVIYVMEKVESDGEGDILYWLYTPLSPYHFRHKCMIYND